MQSRAKGVNYVEDSRTGDAKRPYKMSSVKKGGRYEHFSFSVPANNCSGGGCSYIIRRCRQCAIDIDLAGSRMRLGRIVVEQTGRRERFQLIVRRHSTRRQQHLKRSDK